MGIFVGAGRRAAEAEAVFGMGRSFGWMAAGPVRRLAGLVTARQCCPSPLAPRYGIFIAIFQCIRLFFNRFFKLCFCKKGQSLCPKGANKKGGLPPLNRLKTNTKRQKGAQGANKSQDAEDFSDRMKTPNVQNRARAYVA
jgi:hypothetical protein